MSRPAFTEYVRHMMRFYSRHLHDVQFRSKADEKNWKACHAVISKMPLKTKDILVFVYGECDTLPDNVYSASHKFSINQNIIWDTMKVFERAVATQRGLI